MWLFSSRKNSPRTADHSRRRSFRPRLEVLEGRDCPSAGALDPTFGSGGVVTTALKSGSFNYGDHVVVQPDGKIIAVGEVQTTKGTTTVQLGLVRYNPGGSLDTTFGKRGIVLTSSDYSISNGYWDVALQPDGKIDVMSGQSWAVLQFNANGSLDTTFGSNGKATIPFSGNAYELPRDLVLQPPVAGSTEGKIVVVGDVNRDAGVVGLARLNPGGSLDTTFGNGGTVTTTIGPGTGYLATFASVALQGDGKIVVSGAGPVNNDASLHPPMAFVAARYNSNGSLDGGFGAGGIVRTQFGGTTNNFSEQAHTVLVQPSDGKIVAVGWVPTTSASGGPNIAGLVRYNPDGSLDTSFGSGGIVASPLMGQATRVAAIGSDGNIIVAGNDDGRSFAVGRYLTQATTINGVTYAAGSLDPTFGSNGVVTTSVGVAGSDSGNGIAIQPDGKIVVAGWAQVGSYDQFTVLRYLSSAPQIGAFTANPDPVTAGSSVTLTAANLTASNPNSTVTQVAFYVDSNGDGVLEPGTDTLLGYATQTSPGVWTLTVTINLAPGTYTLFTQAKDNYGVLSDPLVLTLEVL